MSRHEEFTGWHDSVNGSNVYKLPLGLIDRLSRYGPAAKLYDLFTVREIVEAPAVVFIGL